MSTHTPGPWKVVETKRETSNLHIMTNEGYGIADMFDKGSIDDHEMAANAIAISAVPELLAACEEWMRIWQHLREAYPDIEVPIKLNPIIHGTDSWGRLRFAIAKARGEK